MKIIKNILLASISTLTMTCVNAQEVKQEIKPAPSAVPVFQPNPDITGNGKQQQPQLKESTAKPVVVNEKDETIKPQQAPSQIMVTTPVIVTDKRESAVNRAPQVPATQNSSNIAPVPAPRLSKNTAPPQQQQQN